MERVEVCDEKVIEGENHFLVKWKGWPSEYNQWIPQEDIEHATKATQSYWIRMKTTMPRLVVTR
ncbi:Chromo domain-like [Penicillium camemberti]|uniref:Chromo domain-like n=1 Tax=Penicillium camemberti (strain FM 013) TaxID=1429867 RepID=A0A0G4P5L4_PENC3|nr:Chromo domain-like [Penicillium camemberti]